MFPSKVRVVIAVKIWLLFFLRKELMISSQTTLNLKLNVLIDTHRVLCFLKTKLPGTFPTTPLPPTIFERLLMYCMFYVKKLLKVVCNALKFLRASKIGTYHQIWYWALCHSCILQEWAFSLNVNRVLKR